MASIMYQLFARPIGFPDLSDTCIPWNPTRLHGRAEGRMVHFDLVGVNLREVGDRPVEALALAQVGGDLHAVAGAGGRPGQRPAAEARIQGQFLRRKALDLGRALHIPQLAPVEVASLPAAKPAEEDVAACIRRWPATTRCLWCS